MELVTLPLNAGREGTFFAHRGVRITCLPGRLLTPGRTALRLLALVRSVAAARLRLGRARSVEICYDPIGVWISDLTPRKPAVRVAHFHELLRDAPMHLERRLPRAIAGFDHVVVPDAGRARHTQDKLELPRLPLVIENYPLRAHALPDRPVRKDGFEVVYCGSLGLSQKLDAVIQSIPAWPAHATLVLIGDDTRPIAKRLRAMAEELDVSDRVTFLGWMDLPQAEERMAWADLGIALLDSKSIQWRTALGASNKRYLFMKAGLPQIGDTNPGVPELIESNGIGACVTDHDPAQIAAQVAAYAADPSRCRAEGMRAFDLHRGVYNYDAAFRRLLDLWNTPLEAGHETALHI
ncbi:glycosyltransferase [Roseivivax jejudonensis]|uniref:glycosyltransferase n=1 Tax=Roseivivax jejudonensis TaxID=1529041 RepID=UPI0013562FAB|nr:glycosyltransferase [Roseivivax jejudonensis]